MSATLQQVQQYWDAQPCNSRHGPCFEAVAARRYYVEPHIEEFADFAAWAGARVLEVGCGIGTDAIRFAMAGADVTAVDLSAKSLAIARQNAMWAGVRVDFREANAESLGDVVALSDYDLVYSFGAIHHTPSPERVIDQLRTGMREGAELRMMVYATWAWKNLMVRLGRAQREAQAGCPIASRYSARGVRRLLRGFDVRRVEKAHHFTWDIPAYRRGEYRRAWPWRHVPQWAIERFGRVLGTHLLVWARTIGQ
jgi:SAM-dependent methyltransferase